MIIIIPSVVLPYFKNPSLQLVLIKIFFPINLQGRDQGSNPTINENKLTGKLFAGARTAQSATDDFSKRVYSFLTTPSIQAF